MHEPIASRFVFVDDIAIARLSGQFNAREPVIWIGECLAWARLQQHRKTLVSVIDAQGFRTPSLALRVEMVREWAAAAGDRMHLAIVCRAEFIDPQKFGVRVAAGFGLHAEVFTAEEPALEWLRRQA